jgi:hypothetical protein
MTRRLMLTRWILLLIVALIAPPLHAQGVRQVTTTLLPVQAKSGAANGFMWIRQGADDKVDPARDLFLQFDLSGLPPGLSEKDITRVTLRLVARDVVYQPAGDPDTGGTLVIVRGQLATHDFSKVQTNETIVALSTLTPQRAIAQQAGEALRSAVHRQYAAAERKLSLRLYSESHKASTLFYSTASFGATQSNKPRLVIEYTLPAAGLRESLDWTQHQHDPERTGRNRWAPFQNPTGVSLLRIELPTIGGRAGGLADYALLHHGRIYLVYKVLDLYYLLALDFRGNELWRRDIGKGTVQRPPVISRDGIFYVAIDDRIAGYDLDGGGRLAASYTLPGNLSAFTDLTMGRDGSLFLVVTEDGLNYIYGLTPRLTPFIRSDGFRAGESRVSTVTMSADGRQIAAQTAEGLVLIDVAEPALVQRGALGSGEARAFEYYHAPVAGPAGGIVIYSDFTSKANRGNVWGMKGAQRVWSGAGTLTSQPVLGSNGLVYYIQDGALQGHRYDQVGSAAPAKGEGLNATSNLVMDGADNIYWWDNGRLYGYGPNGERLFAQDFTAAPGLDKVRSGDAGAASGTPADPRNVAAGPEQFIRLMLGADGTLWANNRNGDALFAFTPVFAEANPVLARPLATRTVYRAMGVLTLGKGAQVASATQVLLQGRTGISFAPGFAVERGASVLARTGF